MQHRFLIIALLVCWGKETVEVPSLVRKRAISKSDYDEQLQEFLKDLNKQDDDVKDPFKVDDHFQPVVESQKPTIIDKSGSSSFENAGDLESTITEIFGTKEFPKKGNGEGEKQHEEAHRLFESPSPNGQTHSHNTMEEHQNVHNGPNFDSNVPKIDEIFKAPHTHGGINPVFESPSPNGQTHSHNPMEEHQNVHNGPNFGIGNPNLGGPIHEDLNGPRRDQLFNRPNRGNDMNFDVNNQGGSKKEDIFKTPHTHGGLNTYNPNLGGPMHEESGGPRRDQLFNVPHRVKDNKNNQGGSIFKAPYTHGGLNIGHSNLGGPMSEELGGSRRDQLFNGPNRGNDMNFGMNNQFKEPYTHGGLNIHKPNQRGEEFDGPRRDQLFNGPKVIDDLNSGNPNLVGPGKEEMFRGPHRESDTNGGIFLIRDIFNELQRPMDMDNENLPNTIRSRKVDNTVSDLIRNFAKGMKKMWREIAKKLFK